MTEAISALAASEADGYSCGVQSFWPDGKEQYLYQNKQIRGADFLFEGAGQGCTFVIRTSLYSRIREFCLERMEQSDALHYHDWLIYLLTRAWGGVWYFDQQSWIRYRQHGQNEIGSRGGANAITKRLALIRNGWYRKQVASAIRVHKLAAPDSPLISYFSSLFERPDGLKRRLELSFFFIKHGRRRLIDRLVMAVAAMLGWI